MHTVAVEDVVEEHVVVSRGGCVRETAGLIGEDLSGGGDTFNEDLVGARAAGRWCGRCHGVWFGRLQWCGLSENQRRVLR